MKLRLLALSFLLAAGAVLAQSPPSILRSPQAWTPPIIPPDAGTYWVGHYVDLGLRCPRWTTNGATWDACLATWDDVDAGMSAARGEAVSNLVAAMAQQDSARAELAAVLGNRIDSVAYAGATVSARLDALADAGVTKAQLDASMADVLSQLTTAVAGLDARITAVSGRVVCGTKSVVGVQIPLLGVSQPQNVTVPNAVGNRPCLVDQAANLPLTAFTDCDSVDGGALLTFRAAGLLSALSIPTGNYTTCVVNP